VPWLAKDVIWVVPDASCGLVTSMDAWVHTYQSVVSAPAAQAHLFSLLTMLCGMGVPMLLAKCTPVHRISQTQAAHSHSQQARTASRVRPPGTQAPRHPGTQPRHTLITTNAAILQASSAHNESFGRAGVLQQAIILEVSTAAFNAIELSVEGYDGQLPKLDMYWMLKYYSSSWTGLPVLLRGQVQAIQLAEAFKDTPALQQHVASLANLAQFVWRQARGLPLGAHAAFKVYNVDAVTVRLVHEVRPYVLSCVRPAGRLGSVYPPALATCTFAFRHAACGGSAPAAGVSCAWRQVMRNLHMDKALCCHVTSGSAATELLPS
jgi:hypothetical protein